MLDERRRHARITFDTPAALDCAGKSIEVKIIDLSLKGALLGVPADMAPAPQSDCRLQIALDAMTQITMQARVAHCEGSTVGLHCLSIDLDSVTSLRRLVELNLGTPALLERELSALINEE